jgi:hypothetical protein
MMKETQLIVCMCIQIYFLFFDTQHGKQIVNIFNIINKIVLKMLKFGPYF